MTVGMELLPQEYLGGVSGFFAGSFLHAHSPCRKTGHQEGTQENKSRPRSGGDSLAGDFRCGIFAPATSSRFGSNHRAFSKRRLVARNGRS